MNDDFESLRMRSSASPVADLLVLAERLLVGGLSLLAGLRGQSARSLVELNDALVAVLLTTNLLLHRRRLEG